MNQQHSATVPNQQRGFWHLRNHPYAVPVITFLVLFFISIIAFINIGGTTIGAADSHVVHVYVDDAQQIVPTRAANVGDLLKKLSITVGPGDIVEPPPETPIQTDNFTVNIYRARPVTVVDGTHKTTLMTAAQAPRAIAKQAGLSLQPEDTVNTVTTTSVLKDPVIAQQLQVDRATAISLNLYGQTVNLRTHAKTVKQMLSERSIKPDSVSVFPSIDSELQADAVVYVTDPGKDVQLVQEDIPFGTDFVDDFNLLFTTTQVKNEGKTGKRITVYENPKGHPEDKHVLQQVLIADPINRVVARGRKVNTAAVSGDKVSYMAAAGISPSDYSAADFVIGHESGWKPGSVSSNGCYGLGQACPGSKLVSACPNWANDPVCQLRFFSGYSSRYGGWQGAYTFWQNARWW